MKLKPGCVDTGPVYTIARGFLAVLYLTLLSACNHNLPAPVEDQSSAPVKRQLNSDDTYFVRPGDTLYAIAFNYNVDARNMAEWNGIPSPYVIYPGQKLRLSAPPASSRSGGSSSAVRISAIKTPGQATTKAVASPDKTTRTKATSASSSPALTVGKTTAHGNVPVSNSADPKSWKWPTSGRVLRGYVAGDPARNGLDIAGKEGQGIIASAGGQVVYSGNGLISYGELIIIKHSDKMLSAYAHNKVRLVKEGEQVSASQKIAEMGRNAGNEQLLHFEIRARGKPVNPLNYLPKK